MIVLWLLEGLLRLLWAILRFIFWEIFVSELFGEFFRGIGRHYRRQEQRFRPVEH